MVVRAMGRRGICVVVYTRDGPLEDSKSCQATLLLISFLLLVSCPPSTAPLQPHVVAGAIMMVLCSSKHSAYGERGEYSGTMCRRCDVCGVGRCRRSMRISSLPRWTVKGGVVMARAVVKSWHATAYLAWEERADRRLFLGGA